MKLVHTLLFLFRPDLYAMDIAMAQACLRSLEASAYKKVVVYNQGFLSNEQVTEFLSAYDLDCVVIGGGTNAGTAIGRQSCFQHIWEHEPDTEYISELHLDMRFTSHWEDPLIEYLENNEEPLISCGIIDKNGQLPFLNKQVIFPDASGVNEEFLAGLRENSIVHGFTNPCLHVSKILKATGGYNALFLKGGQCFEDDSMLLGYYYYYGTKANWQPKINYNSVVYHAVAGQRLSTSGNVMVNFNGLVKQYGAMGLKALSGLHESPWHKRFFFDQYNSIVSSPM
jgi:hypothetical protein